MKNNKIKNETFKNIENTLINYLSFCNNSKKQLLENVLCNGKVSEDKITIVNTSRVSDNNYSGLYNLFLKVDIENNQEIIENIFTEKLKVIEFAISEELKLLQFHKQNFDEYYNEYIEDNDYNYKIKSLSNEENKKIEINKDELYAELLEGINFLSNPKIVRYKKLKYNIYSFIYYDYNHPINGNILDVKDYLGNDFKGKFINSILEDNKVFLGEIYINSTQYIKNQLKEIAENYIKSGNKSSLDLTTDLIETLMVEFQRKKINRLYEGEIFKKSDDVFEYFIINDTQEAIVKTGCFFLKELYRLDEIMYGKLKENIKYVNNQL